MQEMTKEYVLQTLKEENLWKAGDSDTFCFMLSQMWEFTLQREEDTYLPLKYSLKGKKIGTYETWGRRYISMEAALLHIINHLNENVNVQDRYKDLNEWLLN